MKLTPVNGVHVCQLARVPEMDVLKTFFNFRTIYQVGVSYRIASYLDCSRY